MGPVFGLDEVGGIARNYYEQHTRYIAGKSTPECSVYSKSALRDWPVEVAVLRKLGAKPIGRTLGLFRRARLGAEAEPGGPLALPGAPHSRTSEGRVFRLPSNASAATLKPYAID
jgi:hypothetical protein